MLKIVIKIEEKEEGSVSVGLKKISQKEFDKASRNEKIIASSIKDAIEAGIKDVSDKRKEEK